MIRIKVIIQKILIIFNASCKISNDITYSYFFHLSIIKSTTAYFYCHHPVKVDEYKKEDEATWREWKPFLGDINEFWRLWFVQSVSCPSFSSSEMWQAYVSIPVVLGSISVQGSSSHKRKRLTVDVFLLRCWIECWLAPHEISKNNRTQHFEDKTLWSLNLNVASFHLGIPRRKNFFYHCFLAIFSVVVVQFNLWSVPPLRLPWIWIWSVFGLSYNSGQQIMRDSYISYMKALVTWLSQSFFLYSSSFYFLSRRKAKKRHFYSSSIHSSLFFLCPHSQTNQQETHFREQPKYISIYLTK